MKKFLAVLISLFLVLSFAACSNEEKDNGTTDTETTSNVGGDTGKETTAGTEEPNDTTSVETDEVVSINAFDLIENSSEKMNAFDSMEMDSIIKMTMRTGDEGLSSEMTISVAMNLKMAGIQSGTPVQRIVGGSSAMGSTAKVDIYMKDGYSYYTSEDGNYKVKTDSDDESVGGVTPDMINGKFGEDMLKDIPVVVAENGEKSFELEISKEDFAEAFDELMASMAEDADAELSDITVAYVFSSNDYIKSMDMSFTMSMEQEGVGTTTVQYEMSFDFVNLGAEVVVPAPEGYENYPEVGVAEM
ncbi:MAG: hypothetical protein IJO00_03265 [Clostridia bacterium]|nr:hypothetical protein [Clostridia bacterium]